MLFSLFGPPCPMTRWGVDFVRTIVDAVYGPHDYIVASQLDGLRSAWGARQHKNTVLYSDCPDQGLAAVILKSSAPIIVFAEAPGEIIADVMAERNVNLPDAIRVTCQQLASLHEVYLNSKVMRIGRSSRPTKVSSLAQAVADYFQIELGRSAMDDILRKLVPPHAPGGGIVEDFVEIRTRFPRPEGFPSAGQSGPGIELVRVMQDAFSPVMRRRALARMRWPKEMFYNAEKSGSPLSGMFELLGRSRMLIYGPYLYLPRGRWVATIKMESVGNLSGNSVVADILCEYTNILNAGRVELPRQGRFAFDVAFEVAEPRLPLEARIALERSAIEGSLDLIDVEINREPTPLV